MKHGYAVGRACAAGLWVALTTAWGASTNSLPVRVWTARNGQTVEASFEKVETVYVHLRKADGSKSVITLASLVEADQKLARELAGQGQTKVAKSEPEKPVVPDAVRELFGEELRDNRNKKVGVEALAGKTIGIYFSAHWCPPCRAFTPELVKFHKGLAAAGKPFEVVFVSSDRDSDAMFDYMKEMNMPWLALPHGDKRGAALKTKFGVAGIPKLAIVTADGATITTEGRGDVGRGLSAYDAWQQAVGKPGGAK